MSVIATTADRVAAHTAARINRRIAAETDARVQRLGHRPDALRRRLDELDREWDVERAIELNASTLMLLGTVLGLRVDRRFFALPLAVSAFLLQHAVQGWCPPIPLLRRLGFRTSREIEDERHRLQGRLEHAGPPRRARN